MLGFECGLPVSAYPLISFIRQGLDVDTSKRCQCERAISFRRDGAPPSLPTSPMGRDYTRDAIGDAVDYLPSGGRCMGRRRNTQGDSWSKHCSDTKTRIADEVTRLQRSTRARSSIMFEKYCNCQLSDMGVRSKCFLLLPSSKTFLVTTAELLSYHDPL